MTALTVGAYLPLDDTGPMSRAELDGWLVAAAECGLGFVELGDHVLGVDGRRLDERSRRAWRARWPGSGEPYDHTTTFREPLMLLTYVAARSELGLSTGVVVLPQRQTALFAKQAAELDVLCGGRLRLGVGLGWNPVEFTALGASFADRVAVLEEQIELLRRFWTEPAVDFAGAFHRVAAAGIQVLPVQRPIPIWLGGRGPRTLERVGRLADGWQPPASVDAAVDGPGCVAAMRAAASQAGRDADSIGVQFRVYAEQRSPEALAEHVESWRALGATHVLLDTRIAGRPAGLAEHADRLAELTAVLPAR